MNLLIDNNDEDEDKYDLDEDREPLSPISPYKTDSIELPIPAETVSAGTAGTVTYNMTFDSRNNRWTWQNWAALNTNA